MMDISKERLWCLASHIPRPEYTAMSRPSMWINSADYWISSYFILGEFCYNSKPKLLVGSISEFFPLAHSLELYLKGCLECMNSQSPLLKSHKLFEIWKELKTDESFLPNIVIKDEYITSYKFYDNNDFLKLSHKDFFAPPESLIRSMKYVMELKYANLPYDTYNHIEPPIGTECTVSIFPDDEFLKILGQIRKYITRDLKENISDYHLRILSKQINHGDSLRLVIDN